MRTEVILNGMYEVTDDGEIYKIVNEQRVLAKTYGTSRGYRYRTFAYTENKKQKHMYVHRAIALGLIPNPNNYPQINHIDGNPRNNSVSNLEWCTGSQNVQHAYKIGLIQPMRNAKPCIYCGKLTNSKRKTCARCIRVKEKENNNEKTVIKRKSESDYIDTRFLTEKQKQYVLGRARGFTLQQIADQYGVTTQCVSGAIKQSRIITERANYTCNNVDRLNRKGIIK